jgi:hypothetical protein
MPYSPIAEVKARQTARAVARVTTVAMTQNREWSSIPVMTLHSRPSARNRLVVTSICHKAGNDKPVPKLTVRVRFPSSAPTQRPRSEAGTSATRARSLSRQVLLLVRCAADVTRLWQRVEQNRFPRLREVSM